jgi:hypothetical protein
MMAIAALVTPVWCVLQQMPSVIQARCCAWQRLHQARRGVHSCVQAAAAARVAGRPDISKSATNADGVLVLCHVIVVASRSETHLS